MLREIRSLLFGAPDATPRDPFLVSCENHMHELHRSTFDPVYRKREAEEGRRREWISKRLWHNGEHSHCCKKCFQAGYVIAAMLAEQADLIERYPELLPVFEELSRDGMLESAFAQYRGYSASHNAARAG